MDPDKHRPHREHRHPVGFSRDTESEREHVRELAREMLRELHARVPMTRGVYNVVSKFIDVAPNEAREALSIALRDLGPA